MAAAASVESPAGELPVPVPVRASTADTIPSQAFPSKAAAFFDRVEADFTAGCGLDTLQAQARALADALRHNLTDLHWPSMLPSFVDRAPTGRECGPALAIDIGGSTMRIAVVQLHPDAAGVEDRLSMDLPMDGHQPGQQPGQPGQPGQPCQKWLIGQDVKDLSGEAFFDWIAGNIRVFLGQVTLGDVGGDAEHWADMPLGLVWSFPLSQTSLNDGIITDMGKSFRMVTSLRGKSLHACLSEAFERANLPLRLEAILNDSVSILLAMSYLDPATRLSVIAGTGFNGALRLPAASLAPGKFGQRDPAWAATADHVLVDAELCITGQRIFPKTAWDVAIEPTLLPGPDALGLEVLIGAYYLGEVIRQVVLDAVDAVGFLGGSLPDAIRAPYSMGLETVTVLLGDDYEARKDALRAQLAADWGLVPQAECLLSEEDLGYLRQTARAVMARTAGFLAAAVRATKILQDEETRGQHGSHSPSPQPPPRPPSRPGADTVVSCTGSLIEKCPGFLQQCQGLVDELQATRSGHGGGDSAEKLRLAILPESSLKGAAVAAQMARRQKAQPKNQPMQGKG